MSEDITITISITTPQSRINEIISILAGVIQLQNTTVANAKRRASKLGIPYKCGSAEYQKALRLCRKFGCSYSDALKKSQIVISGADVKSNPINDNEPHWKEVIKKTANPTHTPRIQEG